VISFDGSTTVQEFLLSLNKAINMRDCALSGFALFTDDPNNPELEHCLKMHFKVCTPLLRLPAQFLTGVRLSCCWIHVIMMLSFFKRLRPLASMLMKIDKGVFTV